MILKRLLFTLSLFSACFISAQTPNNQAEKTFIIKGELQGLKSDVKLRLTCWGGPKSFVDSATTKNGKFEITGKISQTSRASLTVYTPGEDLLSFEDRQKTDFVSFFLSEGVTYIKGSSLKNAEITGTPIMEENNSYNKSIKEFLDKKNELYSKITPDNKETVKETMQEVKNIDKKIIETQIKHISQYPDSYISLLFMDEIFRRSDLEDSTIGKILNSMGENNKSTEIWKGIKKTLEKRKMVPPTGSQSIDFTKKDINGKDFTLSSLKGKYVILDFWGSWCGPCRASHPHLKELYEKYKSKGLEIVGIANEKNKDLAKCEESWKKAVADDGMTWIQLLNNYGIDKTNLVELYYIEGFPTKILLDKDGKIILRELGDLPELYSKIKELLGE